jgi:hypothetical protein
LWLGWNMWMTASTNFHFGDYALMLTANVGVKRA